MYIPSPRYRPVPIAGIDMRAVGVDQNRGLRPLEALPHPEIEDKQRSVGVDSTCRVDANEVGAGDCARRSVAIGDCGTGEGREQAARHESGGTGKAQTAKHRVVLLVANISIVTDLHPAFSVLHELIRAARRACLPRRENAPGTAMESLRARLTAR